MPVCAYLFDFAHMAIALFLLALLPSARAMEAGPVAYCGGAGGGDDPDDWGNKFKGQWLSKL